MEDKERTEKVVEETGVGDPLADREPSEGSEGPGDLAREVEPGDATPAEGVEPPPPGESPDPDHVVEESEQPGESG